MSTVIAENFITPNGTGVIPVGTVIMYYGATAPTGYLECDGQSTSGYDDLEALIGSNTPDLRGEFVRGWDNGKGTDSGRSLGSTQGSAYASHNHGVTDPGHLHGIPNLQSSGSSFGCTIAGPSSIVLSTANSSTNPTGITIDYSGSTENNLETRPRNIALMYCIKY